MSGRTAGRKSATQSDWKPGPRFQRVKLRFSGKCCVCKEPVEAGQDLMWDTRFAGNVFCDKCADETQISTPRERGLFDR